MPDADADAPIDPFVEIPPPTWQVVVTALMGLSLLVLNAVGLVALLWPESAPAGRPAWAGDPELAWRRGSSIATELCLALFGLSLLLLARRPAATIGPEGVLVRLIRVPWEKVRSCSWDRNTPGGLHVQTDHTRHILPVPERSQEAVARALRHYGKWAD